VTSPRLSFLEVDDLDPARLALVLDHALAWKDDPDAVPKPLAGLGTALLFEKPSTRTRASTEMAVVGLGGHPLYIRPEERRRAQANASECRKPVLHALTLRLANRSSLRTQVAIGGLQALLLANQECPHFSGNRETA
jgi:ornithine carbamoyltransferase